MILRFTSQDPERQFENSKFGYTLTKPDYFASFFWLILEHDTLQQPKHMTQILSISNFLSP